MPDSEYDKIVSFEDWKRTSSSKWEELELVKCNNYRCDDVVVLVAAPLNSWVSSMYPLTGKVCQITYSNLDSDIFQVKGCPYFFRSCDFAGKLMPKKQIIEKTTKPCKDWTHNEIKKAHNIVTEYMKMLASQRRTLIFETLKNSVKCSMIEIKFNNLSLEVLREEKSTCKDDIFNEDIGMCVAACKVLNKPIPDFILNK